MKTINLKVIRITAVIGFVFLSFKVSKSQEMLNNYIQYGLQNNLVLKQKNISLEKAQISLKEAKGLFLPSLNFNASYLSGEGGRYFNFPLGDIINPVYQTLNQLTQSNSFPQIANAEAYLNPNNFYDAHLRASMPLINTDLYYNQNIQKKQITLQEFEVDIYKRDLVKNIKIAYYNYLSAIAAVDIYKSALILVNKNKEVNESLLKNGKGLPASVLRSKSEYEKVNSALINAENKAINARNYFNFLINKNLDSNIDIDSNLDQQLENKLNLLSQQADFQNREELKSIKQVEQLYQTQLKMNQNFWTPKLNTFIDLGTQAEDFVINDKSKYYLFGLQLDIPIFNGFKNQYKIQKTKLELSNTQINTQLISQQLQLSVEMANNALKSAFADYLSAQKQQQSAESYFKLLETGYREGSFSLIEFLDARNQLTSASINQTITKYKVFQALANQERETANYNLKP